MENFYDFIIVGAGPAGLTAAIIAKRLGFNVIVLEKGNKPGPLPRGETIHHYPILDEILGKGFIESISTHETPERLFHSPKNKYQSLIKVPETSYIFDWRNFIERFIEVLNELDVKINCNCKVLSPIEENNHCIGVNYLNGDKKHKVYGSVILACDGFDSSIGKYYNINYSKINNPTIKCLIKNANIDEKKHSALELFLVANGELDYAPNFPPCALFMFPHGGKDVELGLMIFSVVANELEDVEIPDEKEIWRVWNEIKKSYPGFSEFFKGCSIEYEGYTAIPSANFVKKYIPKPCVILIGDSAGFVEASGSSGLYSSMAMAKFWTELIGKQLLTIKKDSIDDYKAEIKKQLWSDENIKLLKKTFQKTEIYRHIITTYKVFNSFIKTIFKHMRTADKINENWEKLIALLSKAKAGN
ncbi:MAG: FAD-dependent monooxygenase [Promethearchaeia archaeon]